MAFAHHQIVGSEVFKRLDLPSGYAAVRLTPTRRPWTGAVLVMLTFLASSAMLTVAVLIRTGLLHV